MYRIFLVEDDPIIAERVQQHLMSWGWQVRAAADFSRVMEEFAAFDPQLVLLDISCPAITAITGAARSARSPGCR